ncbi:hypothetical protein L917_19940 [Phytophthora nicotianae]|uniref:BED-type domain-containing protein n=1 Tax=Phytophthora nicotianae TaxID=4792 RepID=W2K2L7_PHYNI|nr:hypothetical protein L917_19940 [Phytophthora nicotianae]
MNFTNKDICSLLFTEETPNKAKCCVCGKIYKQGNGYTNQMHHLLKMHPDYPRLAEAAFRRGNPMGLTMADQRTNEIFRSIEWCVLDRMPVSFCERALVRKNASMVPMAASTLQRHIDLLYGYVRDVIAAKLPEKFGLVLDGWSSGGRHFIAIMAVYHDASVNNVGGRKPGYDESIQCVSRRFVLLAFCPLGDEEDLGAQSLFDLIADTLSTFNKPWESLAVNAYLADHEPMLAKIHALMKHLSTIKCRATLRKVTSLAPVMRNATRWSSTFSMVQRYDKICSALLVLDHATVAKHDIAHFLLTPEETEAARSFLKSLHELNEVSKALQDSTLTLVGARRAFDAVLRKYPSMKTRLASDASVVNNPALESGIVKIIGGGRLNAREQAACINLKRSSDDTVVNLAVSKSFLASAFKKAPVTRSPPQHMSLEWVPPTLNECERFFSQAKLV